MIKRFIRFLIAFALAALIALVFYCFFPIVTVVLWALVEEEGEEGTLWGITKFVAKAPYVVFEDLMEGL